MSGSLPYWVEYVEHLADSIIAHVPPGDLKRLVAELVEKTQDVEHAKADAEHEHFLRRKAEAERDDALRQLAHLQSEIRRMERQSFRADP